jgi:hypothetical protein
MRHVKVLHAFLVVAVLALMFSASDAGAATIVVVNNDGPGEGFNDPTVVSPVGGNPGTTLGAQRLYAFQYAADIWGQVLVSSVTIQVSARMDPMFCTAVSAVLGGAGTTFLQRDWVSGNPPPHSGTWYPQALASAIAGIDLNPGTAEISATFNSDIDNNNSCLAGRNWYYGVDGNAGGDVDFVTVVLHEICHGLGFATYQSSSGVWFGGFPDTYGILMYRQGGSPPDYPSMTNGQRASANISDPNLVWDGTNANQMAAQIPLTSGINNGRVRLYGPNPYQSGSSLSHWSTACSPNQLMEPSITGVDHSVVLDLQLLKDTGWTIIEPPACSVIPSSIAFGSVPYNSSKDSTFTVRNVGGGTLTGSISESCLHYSIVSGAGAYSLAAGESVIVTVRFEPTSAGLKNCTILTGTDCSNVSCSGTGIEPPPECVVDPDTLDFGAVDVGNFDTMSFDITNTGFGTLSGTMSESCLYFDILSGGTYSLTNGQSQTVTIIFFPGAAGTHTCTIETGNGLCVDVFCTGTGGSPPTCLVDPDTLDFGTVLVGSLLDTTFIITNTGGDTLSGDVSHACTDYSIISGAGPYSLAADETLEVTVRFEPGSAGLKECTIETGNGLCTDVYCSGTGEELPVCVVEPDTLDFGIVIVGDSLYQQFDIINAGGGILSGSVSDTCTYFDVVAGAGPYGLAAGETLHVTVRFKPGANGSFECWVETGAPECPDVYSTGDGDDVSGLGVVSGKRFFLYQNYPNPFNPSTKISFNLPGERQASLSIYNIEGRLVKTLVNGSVKGGLQSVTWDGTDARGNPVSSGVYLYRLRAGGNVMTKKMILLK